MPHMDEFPNFSDDAEWDDIMLEIAAQRPSQLGQVEQEEGMEDGGELGADDELLQLRAREEAGQEAEQEDVIYDPIPPSTQPPRNHELDELPDSETPGNVTPPSAQPRPNDYDELEVKDFLPPSTQIPPQEDDISHSLTQNPVQEFLQRPPRLINSSFKEQAFIPTSYQIPKLNPSNESSMELFKEPTMHVESEAIPPSSQPPHPPPEIEGLFKDLAPSFQRPREPISPPRKAADEPEGLFKELAPSFQRPKTPTPERGFKQPATPPEVMGQKFEEGLFKDLAPSFQRPREPISPPRKAADEPDFAESSPASPAGVAAAAGAGVGGGSTSLHHSLLGPSLMKAGQEGVDQQKVGEIIYAASVGSKFFENEERRDEALTAKIEELLKKKAKLLPGQLKYEERKADEHIALLESERDLTQVIVHMDCDAFYASVEELDRPDLKLVPMAVGSGVLTTCNYQARKYGIRSGMAGHIAAKICPKLVFIKPNFEKYMKKAEEIRGVIAKYDPRYEATSVDEAYLNLTPYLTAHPELDPEELVHQIRSEILSTTQISISAGIGPNAKLAKVASNINKPNGQFYIPPTREAVMQFISSLPVRSINGVGRVFERELNSVGINTCGDIFTYRSYLMPLWGEKSFTFLLRTYLGIGRTTTRPISEYPRKSVGSETTFADISDPVKLREKLMKIAIELEADMGRVEVAGRTLILKIKMHDYQIFSRQKLCPRPIKTSTDLYNYSVPLLTALEREYPGLKLRLMGLRMTNLVNLAKRENVGSNFFGFQGQQLGLQRDENGGLGNGTKDLKRKRLLDDDGWEIWPEEEFENNEKEEQDQERRLTQELHDAIEASTKSATTSTTKAITFAAANLNTETAPHTNPWDITRSSSKSPQKQPGPLSAFKESHQPSPPPDTYLCPICSKPQPADDIKFNQHIDWCLSRPVIKEATKQPADSKASAAPNHGPRSRAGSKAPEPQEKQGKEKEKKKRRVEGFFEPRGRK